MLDSVRMSHGLSDQNRSFDCFALAGCPFATAAFDVVGVFLGWWHPTVSHAPHLQELVNPPSGRPIAVLNSTSQEWQDG